MMPSHPKHSSNMCHTNWHSVAQHYRDTQAILIDIFELQHNSGNNNNNHKMAMGKMTQSKCI